MLACIPVGLAAGVGLSAIVFRQRRFPLSWPITGMAVLGGVTLFGSIMLAALTGGLGEEVFGTAWGPLIGVFVGCLLGSFVLNSLFGSLGVLAWAVVRMAQGQTNSEGRPRP
jgi:hypothetical protein